MIRSHFLISLILLVTTIFLGYMFYMVVTQPFDMPSQVVKQHHTDKKQPETKKDMGIDKNTYNLIVQKDLFRPSRTVSPPKAMPFTQEKPKLFGTVITNDKKSAILEDPLTKTSRLYNINDSIAGYVVSEIYEDKVVLLMGSEQIEVRLREFKTIQQGVPHPYIEPEQQIPGSSQRPVRPTPRRRDIPRYPQQRVGPTTSQQPIPPEIHPSVPPEIPQPPIIEEPQMGVPPPEME